MAQTEEILEEKFNEIDKSLAKIQNHKDTLQNYEFNFENSYYNSDRRVENDIEIFNYFPENRNKIVQNVESMD